jgi:indole-3-glycerol phosphate synthase
LAIARTYQANQAAAISVLTEEKYFLGSLNYLSGINRALGVNRPPLLRKDFIFDEYQIYESRAFGADALLLITAILGFNDLCKLIKLSRQLQMDCLVEVHNEDEVARALAAGADIIGINNRDLRTFEVDLNTTARLRYPLE